ncbi:MAG: cell division protein ZapA [Endomicrobium sp.]|jgi:cell division protein ZapA|uniref:cell division protein ZapA n=1 Tax=Candidatus Endomicrobiellum cubanum TaxID=3242325 RepID=UPI00281D15A2|nr:cell division protein ZapA [Endomicrobium sp.]MDR2395644.1 cell division protein ZapA [Endomicrobium sp.]
MATTRERIMGRDIELSIDEIDELSFNRIVNFVNEQWMQVRNENVKVPDTQKIAALTAVKIAAELLKLKDLQESISNNYEKKIKDIIKQLD